MVTLGLSPTHGVLKNFQLYADTHVIGLGNYGAIRDKFFKRFEELDRERGVEFLAPIRIISDNYRIEKLKELELRGNEEVFDNNFKYFDEPSPEIHAFTHPSASVEQVSISSSDELVESSTTSTAVTPSDDFSSQDQMEKTSSDQPTSSTSPQIDLDKNEGLRAVSETESDEFSDELSIMFNEVVTKSSKNSSREPRNLQTRKSTKIKNASDVKPKKISVSSYEVPTNLIDFVKEYPYCEVREARKYFSDGEIKKAINLGVLSIRKGRLVL